MDKRDDERDEDMTLGAAGGAGSTSTGWVFLRRHKGAIALFAVAVVAAIAWAVYVFWWFTVSAQSTGLVPSGLGSWTMGHLVNFIVYSFLWELLLVGAPVAVGAILVWAWWRRLPYEERTGYHWRRGRRSARNGGAGFLLFIAFALKVYFDGNWNTPISTYTLNYVVGSMITILVWVAVIVGIPLAIGLTWWVTRMAKRT